MSNITRLGVVSPLFLLCSCISMAPDAEVPAAVSNLPETYSAVIDEPGNYRPAGWWQAFSDPVLNALVDRALTSNLDIVQAAARAERAAAQARVSRAGLAPSLEATAGASYSENPLSGSAFGNFPGGPTRLVSETYSLGLAASYELDLFGRVRDDFRAARSDAVAAQFDLQAVQLATAAEVISAYFDIVDGRFQIANNLLTLDVLEDRAERTQERYQRGLSESFELYQVRQDLRNAEGGLPLRENALNAAEARLALLLAEFPQAADQFLGRQLQPRLVFDPVPSGVPAQLLSQRPDVAAAWQAMEAARLRIGARRAERFPSLRLSASTGAQGALPGDALQFGQNWLLSLAANVVAPIFDNGRIAANIATARASYNEAAAAYGQSVLNAYREANLAISDYEEQRQRYVLISAQRDEARSSVDLQARRYQSGVGDYVAYLDALRGFYQVESSLSSAGRDVALARLGVHRALAGDWQLNAGERAPASANEGEAG